MDKLSDISSLKEGRSNYDEELETSSKNSKLKSGSNRISLPPIKNSEESILDERDFRELTTFERWKKQMIRTIVTHKFIFFWWIGAVVSNVTQGVFLKRSADALPIFPYFLFWFTTLLIFLAFTFYLLIIVVFTKQITSEMWKVKHYKYIILGTLTTVNGIFVIFSNFHVEGNFQAILGPSTVAVPLTIIFSLIMTNRRFGFYQILGSMIISAGIAIAIYNFSHYKSEKILMHVIFMCGSFPVTLSTLYQEKAFIKQPIHISIILFWSALWQCVTVFLSAPIAAIPVFGTASNFMSIFSNQLLALDCINGISISECPQCSCTSSWFPFILYVISYVSSCFFSLGVVKYGNATLASLTTLCIVPLTQFAFTWDFLEFSGQVESVSSLNVIALVLMLLGFVMFRVFDKSLHIAKTKTETVELLDTTFIEDDQETTLHVAPLPTYSTFYLHLFSTTLPPQLGVVNAHYWTFP